MDFQTPENICNYMAKNRYIPLNCSKCGRFIGKDGFYDVVYDDWTGGYEVGYPLCKKCLDRNNAKNAQQRVQPDNLRLQVNSMLYGHYTGNNKSFPDFVQKGEMNGNK